MEGDCTIYSCEERRCRREDIVWHCDVASEQLWDSAISIWIDEQSHTGLQLLP